MRLKFLIAAFALLSADLVPAAPAAPITYTLRGTIDGTLGASTLTNALFTWTVIGDTAAVFSPPPPFPAARAAVPAISSTINLAGFGNLATTNGPFLFLFIPHNSPGNFAFVTTAIGEGVGFGDPALKNYSGLSALAPTSVAYGFSPAITTDHGTLSVSSPGQGIFQAAVGAVPEPLTLSLFGTGLAGLGALRRRHKA